MESRLRRPAPMTLVVAACGCIGCTELLREPVIDEAEILERPVAAETATVASEGVRATTRIWPTIDRYRTQPLAIEVVIENRALEPIVVDYDHFALAAPGGDDSPRIEPMSQPIPDDVRVVLRSGPGEGTIWPGPFSDDNVRRLDPRNPEDLPQWEREPLPERVVNVGETVRGFLFFPVDEDLFPLDLRINVVAAASERKLTTVNVPLAPIR